MFLNVRPYLEFLIKRGYEICSEGFNTDKEVQFPKEIVEHVIISTNSYNNQVVR